jgi:type IV pilus assembly protein PilN
MIKINLLPVREQLQEENIKKQFLWGLFFIVAVSFLLLFVWCQKDDQVQDLKEDKVRKERQLADLRKEVGDLRKLKKDKEDLQKRKESIADLSKNRLAMVKVLDQISALKPDALFFTKLEQQNSGAPWEDFTLILTGVATDNEVIAQYMRKLQRIAFLQEVDLDYTKAKTMKEMGGFQEFRLTMTVAISPKPPKETEQPKAKRKQG